jgi:hypothetical protein
MTSLTPSELAMLKLAAEHEGDGEKLNIDSI